MIFGSGVAGLSVLTHMHTPPTVDFTRAGKPSRTLQYATSRFGCSSSCREWWFILTHRSFPGFTHAVFLHEFANGSAVFFPHGLIVGSALLLTLTHRLGDCNFFPSVVCICFLGDLVPRTGCVFPCCWLWLLWSSLHVEDCGKFA